MTTQEYKVILIGESGVGKSALLQYLCYRRFTPYNPSTIGAAFAIYKQGSPITSHKFSIWDTAGQERYRSIVSVYFRQVAIILLVYDVTNPQSLVAAEREWLPTIRNHVSEESVLIVLIANKIDLEHDPQIIQTGQELASRHNYLFVQTSAKEGLGIQELFARLPSLLVQRNIPCTAFPAPLLTDTEFSHTSIPCHSKFRACSL